MKISFEKVKEERILRDMVKEINIKNPSDKVTLYV